MSLSFRRIPMVVRRGVVGVAVAILATPAARAGGWTQPEGAYYLKAGYRAVPGIPVPQGFDVDGGLVPLRRYGDHALQVYGEFGLHDDWTGVLSATPLGLAAYDGDRALYTGPLRTGIRRRLTGGDWRTAVEVLVGGTPAVGTRDLAPEIDVIWRPAFRTWSASGALQLGHGFGKNWLSVDLGYRWNSGLADVAFATAQVGRQWDRLTVDLHVPVSWSLIRLTYPPNYMGSGDTQYVGVGLGIGWWFTDRIGVATGLEGVATARGNAASLTLPLFVQLR